MNFMRYAKINHFKVLKAEIGQIPNYRESYNSYLFTYKI